MCSSDLEIDDARESFDRLFGHRAAREAKLAQSGGCHECDQQAENRDNDENFQQREAAIAAPAASSTAVGSCPRFKMNDRGVVRHV